MVYPASSSEYRSYALSVVYEKFTEQAAVYFRQISVSNPAVHTQPPLLVNKACFLYKVKEKKASTGLADAT
jgi:hypothetical protein